MTALKEGRLVRIPQKNPRKQKPNNSRGKFLKIQEEDQINIGRMEGDGHWLDPGDREEGETKDECEISDLNKQMDWDEVT